MLTRQASEDAARADAQNAIRQSPDAGDLLGCHGGSPAMIQRGRRQMNAVVIALAMVVFVNLIYDARWRPGPDIAAVRTDMKADVAGPSTDLHRTEATLKADVAAVRNPQSRCVGRSRNGGQQLDGCWPAAAPYRAASIVVTAVMVSRSAEISLRPLSGQRSGPSSSNRRIPLRLFGAPGDASGATAWAGVAAAAASPL
jgi:hypothetical protein